MLTTSVGHKLGQVHTVSSHYKYSWCHDCNTEIPKLILHTNSSDDQQNVPTHFLVPCNHTASGLRRCTELYRSPHALPDVLLATVYVALVFRRPAMFCQLDVHLCYIDLISVTRNNNLTEKSQMKDWFLYTLCSDIHSVQLGLIHFPKVFLWHGRKLMQIIQGLSTHFCPPDNLQIADFKAQQTLSCKNYFLQPNYRAETIISPR